MSTMRFAAPFAAVMLQTANAYSSYIEDCFEFAAKFDATCGGTQDTDVTSYVLDTANWYQDGLSVDYTCSPTEVNQFMNCPDSGVG